MISHPQSGYMLPDGFRVVSSVFENSEQPTYFSAQ